MKEFAQTTDEIEMEVNQILLPGLVTYPNILFGCTQTNTIKVKQSNGK